MKTLLLVSFLLLSLSSFTQIYGEFDQVDLYARSAPKNAQSIDDLVSYFSSRSSSQIEKARLIYVWLTDNISYDARAYNLKNPGDNSPSSVFKSKKAVCAGFASLYTELGEKLGLEIETISGVAKGYEYEENVSDELEESINHAWNVIRIDGAWRVFDATWGEGYGSSNKKGKLESTKKFDESWFNLDPKKAIFSHFPGDVNKQFVHPTISFESYLNLPYLTPEVFDTGWISPDEILFKFNEKKKIDLPNFVSPLSKLKLSAPKDRVLKKGKPHDFILESNEIKNAFIYFNEEEIIPFVADGKKFKYTLNSKSIGTYQLVVSVQNEQLFTILEYVIE